MTTCIHCGIHLTRPYCHDCQCGQPVAESYQVVYYTSAPPSLDLSGTETLDWTNDADICGNRVRRIMVDGDRETLQVASYRSGRYFCCPATQMGDSVSQHFLRPWRGGGAR